MVLVKGPDAQLDTWIPFVKGAEVRSQPQRRDAGGAQQRNGLSRSVREQLVGNRIQTIQGLVHRVQIGPPGTGQRQPSMVPDKQCLAQVVL